MGIIDYASSGVIASEKEQSRYVAKLAGPKEAFCCPQERDRHLSKDLCYASLLETRSACVQLIEKQGEFRETKEHGA
jgi:hypothetical protein